MGQIVFGVRDNKIGMGHRVISTGCPDFWATGTPAPSGPLESSFISGEADKMFIETVEPAAQFRGGIPCGIGGHKNEFDLIRDTRGQFFQGHANIRHVHGTLIGAIGVAEKEERNRPLGSVPKIKPSARGVRENKSRLAAAVA